MKLKHIYLLFFLYGLSGCITYKDIVDFKDVSIDSNSIVDTLNVFDTMKLHEDDIIQVFVSSYNKEEANRFNLLLNQQSSNQSTVAGATIIDPFGYRIDRNGNIEMPLIGEVHVSGYTLEEAKIIISEKIKKTNYLNDFNVHLQFLSFRITILGEVNSPGSYTVPSQKINVLQALGLAKDVTLFSKRNNIMVIREEKGKKTYGRIDLTSKKIFNSKWYNLKSNDIVYVQPHLAKILAAPDPASRYVSTAIAIVSLVLLIIK